MKKTEKPINLDVRTLQKSSRLDYCDEQIVIIDNLNMIPVDHTLKSDMIFLMLCTKGKLQLSVNGNDLAVHANEVFACPPSATLYDYRTSKDFESKIVGFPLSFLQQTLHGGKDIWNLIFYLFQHPILRLEEDDMYQFEHFYDVLRMKIRHPSPVYQKEIMHTILQCLFYELCVVVHRTAGETQTGVMTHGDMLFKRFILLLNENRGANRSVAHYAQALCVSPKYLSTTVRQCSGRKAMDWIHAHMMDEITFRLKYTDKSIKEIATELEFSNISFFGKFVKSRVGMTPRKYRDVLFKQNKK